MSLYPSLCKYFKVPPSLPKIHVGHACNNKQTMLSKESLIKCTVLPLKRIDHHVLHSAVSTVLFCLSISSLIHANFRVNAGTNQLPNGLYREHGFWTKFGWPYRRPKKVLEIFEVYEYEVEDVRSMNVRCSICRLYKRLP
jgi:hypothetical protein